jgi:2-polyprenyl-6-methoxyphenol hydroxylase-like FAD-dependent oxidoreductase
LPDSCLADPRITVIHGAVGTFGYGGISQASPNKLVFFSFFDTDLPARGSKPDPQKVTESLRKRHEGWADPMIAQCLAQTGAIDTVYPLFYMPDLPSWGHDGCVLVGDAAHAMTPATGQGGSQAFEDGLTLALLLEKFLGVRGGDREGAIEESIRGLYAIRAEHVYAIKQAGLAIKEPARPWSWRTTLGVYGFYFVVTKAKWLAEWFGQSDTPAHLFNVRGEVERYVAARS